MKKKMAISLVFVCVVFSAGKVWGFTEGGPSNFFGQSAGFSNTGTANNFFGSFAGYSNTTGTSNNFFGHSAGYANTTSHDNSFFGSFAGYRNTTGTGNNFFGSGAGKDNTTGNQNSFFGDRAGLKNTTGNYNSFFGKDAGFLNTTSNYNNFFGVNAGYKNATGTENNFFGVSAGQENTTGSYNSFFGTNAGYSNTTSYYNNFFGSNAGFKNTTGTENNFFGSDAGHFNTTGNYNSYFGTNAGHYITTGNYNSFFGHNTGFNNTTGSGNVFLGYTAGYNETGSNKLYIANSVTDSPLIYGEFNNQYLEVNGSLGVNSSDGNASLLVKETSPTIAKRFLLELNNNGAPGFTFLNSNSGDEWQFSQDQNGNFIVSRLGTGGAELKITKSGSVIMGPGSTVNFALAPNGNLTIGGTLIQNSDINTKENLDPVEGQEILTRLRELPISTWNLKTDEDNARHLGPMAQDFYAAFGLGSDERHIAPLDVGGVALVAIQEMQALLKEKGARIDELEKRLLNLEKKLNTGIDSI